MMTIDNSDRDNARNQALRKALYNTEMRLPVMPPDLNSRVMRRMDAMPQHRRTIWPWIAAACAAIVLSVYLMPPKAKEEAKNHTQHPVKVEPVTIPKAENKVLSQETDKPAERYMPKTEIKKQQLVAANAPGKSLLAEVQSAPSENQQVCLAMDNGDKANNRDKVENGDNANKHVVITEKDIPVTRPENLKYTPEEIATLKKRAHEAYVAWVQLELQISEFNVEQTAQQIKEIKDMNKNELK